MLSWSKGGEMTHETFDLTKSRALYDRARVVMPGGVNASARFNPTLKQSLFMERGQGAYLYDVDGHRYIDYCVSHGASLLGHGHPAVVAAVQSVLARGILCAYETEEQLAVAERLLPLFPGAEMVRFTGSGTEATWHALRLARAYTGRWGVAKFEGHYHGVNDTLGFSCRPALESAGPPDAPYAVPDSAGIPSGNAALMTVLPFNDIATLERTLRRKGDTLAALIMEPINYDAGGLCPTPEFIAAVRALTRELGILLIFDEVLSGFRVGPGPALGTQGVLPDLTVLGKAVGGGLPLSIILGPRRIMESYTPAGPALQSGTYNAHLLQVIGARALLDEVSKPGFYEHLDALGTRLYAGMREIFSRRHVTAWVQGIGARFGLLFGLDSEPRNYRDTMRQDLAMMGSFHLACLKRGVYLHHFSPHHGYSSAHTLADIEETLDVMDEAAKEIA
jgi:glutamate-1-semialdehyde 2,1-aminomutase